MARHDDEFRGTVGAAIEQCRGGWPVQDLRIDAVRPGRIEILREPPEVLLRRCFLRFGTVTRGAAEAGLVEVEADVRAEHLHEEQLRPQRRGKRSCRSECLLGKCRAIDGDDDASTGCRASTGCQVLPFARIDLESIPKSKTQDLNIPLEFSSLRSADFIASSMSQRSCPRKWCKKRPP